MIRRMIEQVKQDEDDDFHALGRDTHWQLANSGEFCVHTVPEYAKLT